MLIGGLALAAHGVVRGTKDVDIVPDPDPVNIKRLAAALAAMSAQVDLGDIDAAELGIQPDPPGSPRAATGCWRPRSDDWM